MRTIDAERVVDAPPAAVWRVLTDVSAYPEWNPFVTRVEGSFREGARPRVRIEPPGSRDLTFRPEVRVVRPERQLVWAGHLVVPYLFDGRHEFRLEPIGDGDRTRLSQRETFTGLLVWLLLDADAVRRGFEAMNARLAERAERLARA